MADSWQKYIDKVLLNSGYISQAAIHSMDSGQVWAASPGFEIQDKDVMLLVERFANPDALRTGGGFQLMDSKFVCLRAEPDFILGRKSSTGCSICKCNRCVIIAIYEEGVNPGTCHSFVMKLGDYLKEKEF